ncbi:MAG: phosphoglycerate kinase [Candidatus Nealsonbacteria bacterium]|nr:phosphoglycerate kinase [Candidatus Nealsonbacteria bacterium]
MKTLKAIKNFNFKGKKVLVRCDFNVPLSEKGDVLDDFRIKASLPTIEYLIKKGAKLLLMSHMGRSFDSAQNQKSKAERQFVEARREKRTKFSATIKNQKYSLKPIASKLETLLNRKVKFLRDCVGEVVEREIRKMRPKGIVLLENLRFYKEEEEGNPNFAQKLAKLADIYINDAFSVCHRSHASVVGITKYLPSAAGFLLEKEIKVLSQVMNPPAGGLKRPLVVIIGGSKVQDKARVIERFLQMADWILIGNLISKEIKQGKIELKKREKVVFPLDSIKGLDIGEKTIAIFKEKIFQAKTVFWAGPLGKIEEKKYQRGTEEIARTIIKSNSFSIIGGGDTIKFISRVGLIEKFNHVSIGGSALLAFLSGEKLPGLKALK